MSSYRESLTVSYKANIATAYADNSVRTHPSHSCNVD